MAAPLLIDRERLEQRYGSLDVGEYDGVATAVALALQVGSDDAWSILRMGFSEADIITLCANDEVVRHSIAGLAMDALSSQRKEWRTADGKGPYAADASTATKKLESIADGHRRTVAETAADVPATRLLSRRARTARTSVLGNGGF